MSPTITTLVFSILLSAAACRPQPIVIHASEPVAAGASLAATQHGAPNIVTVQGMATLAVAPDVLDLNIELLAEDRRPDRAISEIRKRQAALEAALDAQGLAKVERTVGQLALQERYEQRGNESIKVGYQAQIMLRVCIRDFDQVGSFMQIASENGARSMSTQFRSTTLSEKKMEVREQAVAAAMAKAEQLSRLSGVKLEAVVGISESDHREAYWGQSTLANSYTPAQVNSALRLGDTQELSIDVTISYRLAEG